MWWIVMGEIDGRPSFPNCARICQIGRVFRGADLDFLAVQADFGDITTVKKVSVSKQERRKNRTGNMENGLANLKDMPASCLTREYNMFPGREIAGRTKMLQDLREIGKLGTNEERLINPNARHGVRNRISISGEITNAKLMRGEVEMANRKENVEKKIPLYAIVYKRVSRKSS